MSHAAFCTRTALSRIMEDQAGGSISKILSLTNRLYK